ncbi:hypothetical protein ACFV6Z_08230 [Streptomyces sp. NPDC059818]|uniref:hypothetical protein n=1 Tax=Streptomyces sp. NPDC059818 TaxID=3346962 RepID=UPI003667A082
MLISNLLGVGDGSPSRRRRGYVLAAVLTAAVCGGVVPAAAEGTSPIAAAAAAADRPTASAAVVAASRLPAPEGFEAGRAHAQTMEANSSHGALAPTRTRTLVLAVIGSAAGLAVFVGGGLAAVARGRNGFGR